jgi:hypothetical protein
MLRKNDRKWTQERVVSCYLIEESVDRSKHWEMNLKEYDTQLTGWKWHEQKKMEDRRRPNCPQRTIQEEVRQVATF